MDINKIFIVDFKTMQNLNELKEIAKNERTYLNNRYHIEYLKNCLDRKAIEVAFKTAKYQNYNDNEKMIIASNIVFDNQKFASILNNGNFDIKSLQAFLKLVNYFVNNCNGNNLSEDDKKYLEIANKFERKLINYFKRQVGVTYFTIIINKLNELLTFEPELLTKKVNKHTR